MIRLLFILVSVFFQFSESIAQITLTKSSHFDITELGPLNTMNMEVAEDSIFYLVSVDGYKLIKYDAVARKILNSSGRQGDGPGEFKNPIQHIRYFNDSKRLYVSTMDGFINLFDSDLNYIQREYIGLAITQLEKQGSRYVFSAFSMSDAFLTKNPFNLYQSRNLFDDADDKISSYYNLNDSIPNFHLNRLLISSNRVLLGAIRVGSFRIHLINNRNELQKTYQLYPKDYSDFTFRDDPFSDFVKSTLQTIGFTDFRLPSGTFIHSIAMGNRYTIMQGGSLAEYKFHTMLVVDHYNWNIMYGRLPAHAHLIRIHDDVLYLMGQSGTESYIQSYNINTFDMITE